MITGCGWNDTCSRRSICGRTRSTNGMMKWRPGSRVLLVAAEPLHVAGPRLEADPHRADHHQRDQEGDDSSDQGSPRSLPRVHEGGRALDLDHVDGRAGEDHQRLVIGAGRPLLAADPHPPGLAGDLLHHPRLPPHQRRHPEPVLRPVAGPRPAA